MKPSTLKKIPDMTPVIEEMHAMLTELLAKQRLTIQQESVRLALEKTNAEKAEKSASDWKTFVFEEKMRRDIQQNVMLNERAAFAASETQAKIDAKRWWSFLVDW